MKKECLLKGNYNIHIKKLDISKDVLFAFIKRWWP